VNSGWKDLLSPASADSATPANKKKYYHIYFLVSIRKIFQKKESSINFTPFFQATLSSAILTLTF